jgi:arylsulfatase A-like enzyme
MPHSCTTRNTYIATDANPEHLPAEDFDYWKGFAGQGAYFPEGPHGRHLTTLIADQAIEFLNNRQTDKPFCLSVSFKAPHLDFEPDPVDMHLYQNIEFPKPETAKQKYFEALPPCVQQSWGHTGYWQNYYSKDELYQDSVRKCYQLITGADRAIGRVMRELQRLGIRENTIIIMMSDNGYMKGEHFLGGKALLYEESIRVPLIISDPRVARSKQGRRNSELVLNIDLAPTILSMAGIEAPNNMDGRDITALVHGNNQNLREEFLCENNFRLGSKSDMPIWPDWSNQYYPFCSGLRTRTHKYIKYTEESPLVEELFDLTNDPLETVNLANIAEHKHILTMFRNQYDALTQKL